MPMADDLCVESDSGGHTNMGIMSVLLPTIIRQRDELMNQHQYTKQVRVVLRVELAPLKQPPPLLY